MISLPLKLFLTKKHIWERKWISTAYQMCGSLLAGFKRISKCSKKPTCVLSTMVWNKCNFLWSLDPSRTVDPLWTLMKWQWTWNTEGVWNTFNWPSLFSFCCCQCFCQHILLGWLKASSELLRCIYKGAKSPCILAGCLVLSWKPAWGAKQERDAPYSQDGFAIDRSSSASEHYCRRPSHSENTFM